MENQSELKLNQRSHNVILTQKTRKTLLRLRHVFLRLHTYGWNCEFLIWIQNSLQKIPAEFAGVSALCLIEVKAWSTVVVNPTLFNRPLFFLNTTQRFVNAMDQM